MIKKTIGEWKRTSLHRVQHRCIHRVAGSTVLLAHPIARHTSVNGNESVVHHLGDPFSTDAGKGFVSMRFRSLVKKIVVNAAKHLAIEFQNISSKRLKQK